MAWLWYTKSDIYLFNLKNVIWVNECRSCLVIWITMNFWKKSKGQRGDERKQRMELVRELRRLKTMGVDNRCPVRRKERSGFVWFCTVRMRRFVWFWYLPLISLSVARKSRTATKVKCNYGILQGSLQVIDFNSLFTFFFPFNERKARMVALEDILLHPTR